MALVSRGGGWLLGRCLFIVRGLYGVTGFRQHNQLTPPAGKESTNRPTGRFSPSTTVIGAGLERPSIQVRASYAQEFDEGEEFLFVY